MIFSIFTLIVNKKQHKIVFLIKYFIIVIIQSVLSLDLKKKIAIAIIFTLESSAKDVRK